MGKDNWSTIPSVFFGNHKPSEYIQEFKNKIRVDKLTKKIEASFAITVNICNQVQQPMKYWIVLPKVFSHKKTYCS